MPKKIIVGQDETLEFIRARKAAYQLTFGTSAGQKVLEDLAPFCRAGVSCFNSDPRIHADLEGRREVWLRIADHMHLTTAELYELYAGRPLVDRIANPLQED